MVGRIIAIAAAALLLAGCGSAPAQDAATVQRDAGRIASAIYGLYRGTSQSSLIGEVNYDGQTVTVKTSIYPDTDGVALIKQARLGIWTTATNLDPPAQVKQVCIVDAGGNRWCCSSQADCVAGAQ